MSDTLEHFEGLLREYMQGNASRDAVDVARDTLRTALAAAQGAQWQDIATAPKDGALFLCWVSAVRYDETDEGQQYQQDASQVDFCSWRDGPSDLPGHGYFDPCCGQIADSQDVTHWMPLPAAPGASPPAAPEVPDGWALVPAEPTDAMAWAGVVGLDAASSSDLDPTLDEVKAVYRAMLAAAPQAPADTQAPAQGRDNVRAERPETAGEKL